MTCNRQQCNLFASPHILTMTEDSFNFPHIQAMRSWASIDREIKWLVFMCIHLKYLFKKHTSQLRFLFVLAPRFVGNFQMSLNEFVFIC
jgi:hypothetical protein